MDPFDQTRACVELRLLCDAERDWYQATLEITGVDRKHLLCLNVHHPEPLSELPSHLPRLLLEIVGELRASLPRDGLREPDAQTF